MFSYTFSRKKLTRAIRWLVALWFVDFGFRVLFYVLFGEDFLHSSGIRVLATLSGALAGSAATLMIIRSKAVSVIPAYPVKTE